jgi:two-component system response regulator AtoC
MAKQKILVVEDETLLLWAMQEKLTAQGYQVIPSQSGEEALALFVTEQPDLVMLDITLPGIDGFTVLEQLRKTDSETAIIMVTAKTDYLTAVAAMKSGANNYLGKPFQFGELFVQVEKALQETRLKRELKSVHEERNQQYRWSSLIGDSPVFLETIELAKKMIASSPTTILILGESGTGKDLLATVLHYESPRREMPFIEVNCSAIPESLLESELMGHEKGAFTDAKLLKKGLFELADGGTIFLNEIGALSLPLQAKLLHLIENRRFRRVGGIQDIEVDILVITATNRDLRLAITGEKFREDLYYRLQVLPLFLSPLRDRGEDTLKLADYFLTRFNLRCKKFIQGFAASVQQQLLQYSWPGNVRELSNVIERAVILCTENLITEECLPRLLGGTGISEINIIPQSQFKLPKQGCKLEEVEKELIIQALTRCQENQTQAALLVGLSRDALRYRLQKYGLI